MTATTAPVGGLRGRKKAQTRAAIIEAAWILFQQKGVSATSIREVAELADVSDTTVLNYFTNKNELVEAAVDRRPDLRELVALVRDRPPAEPPATAVRRATAALGDSLDDADARQSLRLWRAMDTDIDLRGSYLRLQVSLADELAEALRDRSRMHGYDDLSIDVYCRSVLGAIDAIARRQPHRPTAKAWMRQVDEILARLEKGWKQ